MDAKVFGQFIAGIRKEKHMTQADLAQIIGVTDKAVSRWERGLGFPDISTLEPLAAALGVSVLELMRSQKEEMKKEDQTLAEGEVTEIMLNAAKIAKENQRQDRISLWLGGSVLAIVTVLVKGSGHGSVGGGIIVGAFAALLAVGIYLFARNGEDPDSRRIYSAFALGGAAGLIGLLRLMGADPWLVTWGVYLVLSVFVVIGRR